MTVAEILLGVRPQLIALGLFYGLPLSVIPLSLHAVLCRVFTRHRRVVRWITPAAVVVWQLREITSSFQSALYHGFWGSWVRNWEIDLGMLLMWLLILLLAQRTMEANASAPAEQTTQRMTEKDGDAHGGNHPHDETVPRA